MIQYKHRFVGLDDVLVGVVAHQNKRILEIREFGREFRDAMAVAEHHSGVVEWMIDGTNDYVFINFAGNSRIKSEIVESAEIYIALSLYSFTSNQYFTFGSHSMYVRRLNVSFYSFFRYILFLGATYLTMNIVLVCIRNFQEYILQNIKQLLHLGHQNIYVLTNTEFFAKFSEYSAQIMLINVDQLHESYGYDTKSGLDDEFRNQFTKMTSLRFFYIYEFMDKYNVRDVIHLENDVLVYYNCDVLEQYLDKRYVYLPFDTYQRNVASIMYIPSAEVFKTILDHYHPGVIDMFNFGIIRHQVDAIRQFPIFANMPGLTPEQQHVSSNSHIFPYIFDGAAIGQFIGGIDPANREGDTRGFVNERCVIKYNQYSVQFKQVDGKTRPVVIVNGRILPVFNLHIHSKDLALYTNQFIQ